METRLGKRKSKELVKHLNKIAKIDLETFFNIEKDYSKLKKKFYYIK